MERYSFEISECSSYSSSIFWCIRFGHAFFYHTGILHKSMECQYLFIIKIYCQYLDSHSIISAREPAKKKYRHSLGLFEFYDLPNILSLPIFCLVFVFGTLDEISTIEVFLFSHSSSMANIFNKFCSIHLFAYTLVLVGALNWWLVALGWYTDMNLNIVNLLLGSSPMVERAAYLLVGLSALIMLFQSSCNMCDERHL